MGFNAFSSKLTIEAGKLESYEAGMLGGSKAGRLKSDEHFFGHSFSQIDADFFLDNFNRTQLFSDFHRLYTCS